MKQSSPDTVVVRVHRSLLDEQVLLDQCNQYINGATTCPVLFIVTEDIGDVVACPTLITSSASDAARLARYENVKTFSYMSPNYKKKQKN